MMMNNKSLNSRSRWDMHILDVHGKKCLWLVLTQQLKWEVFHKENLNKHLVISCGEHVLGLLWPICGGKR